jgi:hypothetical protein
VGKYSFLALEGKNGTSSLHREMEMPSKKVAWGEEKFPIKYMQENEREGKRSSYQEVSKVTEVSKESKGLLKI